MTLSNPRDLPSLQDDANDQFKPALSRRYRWDRFFEILTWLATLISLVVLVTLLLDVLSDGASSIDFDFLTSPPSRKAAKAGLWPALMGTVWLLCITAAVAFPIGVGSGIFLEEFAPDNLFTRIIEINVGNLAAVPSIVYGLLGLTVFVDIMRPITGGNSVLAGGLTLALLILPIIIVSTREALRAVPSSLRQGGFSLGATRWQVIRDLVFPQSLPGILTGTILALSRAIGETAPILVVGAAGYIAFAPPLSLEGLQSDFTALPIQIYVWIARAQKSFEPIAAGGIIILLVVLLLMNTTAILLRNKFQNQKL
ncbi:phosphate ABC transporter permease PstA [Acaryochloris sp. CCMEE 5410]|uniref:phosphate ABC transporter permease PstA n=1 Tax=Acaryochloris sp. CCMEE 5410 TaxID=310037 RepID=UPI0002484E6C|nr:phosphate ABC transporter permease PstA [Acaryochloris sp. CCMEE 5410]KAI9130383.1 phosphate ABC transporter permease PstA [Acaryochloris sp. CCMEE 5410]